MLQAIGNIFSFTFAIACLSVGKFLAFDFKGFSFQPACRQAGVPGCSSRLKAECSEIKPVEPGQGNACEGKEYFRFTFLNSISLLFFNR
jgi:hypothetical protein